MFLSGLGDVYSGSYSIAPGSISPVCILRRGGVRIRMGSGDTERGLRKEGDRDRGGGDGGDRNDRDSDLPRGDGV